MNNRLAIAFSLLLACFPLVASEHVSRLPDDGFSKKTRVMVLSDAGTDRKLLRVNGRYLVCPGVFREYSNNDVRCRIKRPGFLGFAGIMDDAEPIPLIEYIEQKEMHKAVIHDVRLMTLFPARRRWEVVYSLSDERIPSTASPIHTPVATGTVKKNGSQCSSLEGGCKSFAEALTLEVTHLLSSIKSFAEKSKNCFNDSSCIFRTIKNLIYIFTGILTVMLILFSGYKRIKVKSQGTPPVTNTVIRRRHISAAPGVSVTKRKYR